MKPPGMKRIWPKLERYAMRQLWRMMALSAHDRTATMASRSCVILAPHPDDETLGCGGLAMRKLAEGTRVDVIVATDGAATHPDDPTRTLSRDETVALRERETLDACEILGIAAEHVRFLRHPDGALSDESAALEENLARALAEIHPDEVYVCALADGHRDHVALAIATRNLAVDGRLHGAALWEYPVWFWDFRSWRPDGYSNKRGFILGLLRAFSIARRTRVISVATRGLEARKRKALECHRSQVGLLEDEPDWVGLPETFLSFFFRGKELFFQWIRHPNEQARRYRFP